MENDMEKETDEKELPDFWRDENGVSMLEFILVAPALCYLMFATLFFQHEIDYIQDSIVQYRHTSWTAVLPGNQKITQADSDQNGFNTPLGFPAIRTTVTAAPVGGIGAYVMAAERYFNVTGSGAKNAYGRLGLLSPNYRNVQDPAAPIPPNPWANVLGGLGRFFGERIGGGTWGEPQFANTNWVDSYPLIVDPWQRELKRSEFKNLAVTANPIALVSMNIMYGLTLFRSNTFDDVHKVDSSMNKNTRSNSLPTVTGKSKVQKIVK